MFDEEYERFGFAPNASQHTALYKNPHAHGAPAGAEHQGGAQPARPAPRRQRRPRLEALDRPARRAGSRSSTPASAGARTACAARSRSTAGELPNPEGCAATTATATAPSPSTTTRATRASSPAAGHDEADDILDASDLLAAFSDGTDADANGYADDIAGWDFFDDDNDPYDASSYSSASNHGTGRAQEAGQQTNDADGRHGRLPALP